MATRYCFKKFVWDVEQKPEKKTVAFLNSIEHNAKKAILIATSDATTEFVARNAEELSNNYIFPKLDYQKIKSLTCKRQMNDLAIKNNIPTPKVLFPKTREEFLKASENIDYPIMFKGIDGSILKMDNKPKMIKVDSREELTAVYNKWEYPENPGYMLQEFIPGGEDSVWMFNGFFDDNSECLFGITGKKIRQYPAYKGATSLGVCLHNDHVHKTTCRFMKALGYKGILDIGYRYDTRDGKYKVLDLNPRIGSSFRLFVGEGGMDVARVLYLSLTNQSIPESSIIEGRKWMVENQDLASTIQYFRDGKLKLGQYLKSFKGLSEVAWFAKDDMKPFFKMCKGYLKKAIV